MCRFRFTLFCVASMLLGVEAGAAIAIWLHPIVIAVVAACLFVGVYTVAFRHGRASAGVCCTKLQPTLPPMPAWVNRRSIPTH